MEVSPHIRIIRLEQNHIFYQNRASSGANPITLIQRRLRQMEWDTLAFFEVQDTTCISVDTELTPSAC